jgi:hypothetical protein
MPMPMLIRRLLPPPLPRCRPHPLPPGRSRTRAAVGCPAQTHPAPGQPCKRQHAQHVRQQQPTRLLSMTCRQVSLPVSPSSCSPACPADQPGHTWQVCRILHITCKQCLFTMRTNQHSPLTCVPC